MKNDRFIWDDDDITFVNPERADYSPDQPRAADGEFGEGGGSDRTYKKQNQSFRGSLTDSEYNSLRLYTGSGYRSFNYAMRHDEKETYNDDAIALAKHVANLDSAIAKSKTTIDMIVHRGIDGRANDMMSKLKVGATFSDKAWLSTSEDANQAGRFANDGIHPEKYLMHIHVPSGHAMAPISLGMEEEKEWLLPRNTRMKITKVSQANGRTVLDAEVL